MWKLLKKIILKGIVFFLYLNRLRYLIKGIFNDITLNLFEKNE